MRGKFLKIRKGEASTGTIIMVVFAILALAVLLYFLLFKINPQSLTNKEICHDSVVLRATTKNVIGSLNCKTDYVCISGGGKCRGVEPTITVKVNPNSKEEIMSAIASEMKDCWWMFGEAKLNFLNLIETQILKRTTCAVCSVINFDDKVLEKGHQVTYEGFYNYLNSIKKSESETYFHYLYNSYSIEELQEKSYLKADIKNTPIITNDNYVVLTGYIKGLKLASNEMFLPITSTIIYPYYIKASDVDSGFEFQCQDFITTA